METRNPFADLESDLDGTAELARRETEEQHNVDRFKLERDGFLEPSTKLSRSEALRRWRKGERTKALNLNKRIAEWQERHRTEWGWITGCMGRFDFARSMHDALMRWGSLTDGQLAAVRRCLERDVAPRETPIAKHSVAGAGFDKLIECFARASKTLKHPALEVHTDGMLVRFKPAKADGKHPNNVYVTVNSTYVGRIDAEGGFFPTRSCVSDVHTRILDIGRDPIAAAVASGHKTGRCAICTRRLDNEESVARGIGPICYERFFG